MATPDNLLADYREDVLALFGALEGAHEAAVARAAGLSSGVERALRAGADLVSRSLGSLAKMRRAAVVCFGGGAIIALVILMGFRDNAQAHIWADLLRPLMLLAAVFCGAPTAILGWRHLMPVYARWWGKQSDRWVRDGRIELFLGQGGQAPPGKLSGILVSADSTRIGQVDLVDSVAAPGATDALVMVRLPNGELMHMLNARTLVSETWFNELAFLREHSSDFAKTFVDECRQAGVLDALPELQRLLLEQRKAEGGATKPKREDEVAVPDLAPVQTGTASSWESLILDEDFKDRLQTTVAALRNAKLLRAQGFEPPSSLLLYGPPGTGKTEVARTLANMSGMAFFAAKGSDVRAGYLGHSAPRIKALFEQARLSSPAIVFIDELDVVAARRDAAHGDKDRLSDELVAELLVELDGVVKAEGDVFFMAATNFPDKVDSALLNRFRERREVPLPSQAAREAMLRVFLLGKACEEDVPGHLEGLAARTEGCSGRDLRNLVNAAAERAVARALKNGHIERVVVSVEDLSQAAGSLAKSA